MGKVYLIGAGPGDSGLITVKGMEKIKECDALVYDRLASPELLEAVKPECQLIYVGKEAGKHYKKQEEINEILVKCAADYKLVVRLKGGDPFVFGRGGEEIEALIREGIAYEVIPGVTSAVAAAECAGIPVTHRAISRSFHVITGHTNTSVKSPDYDYKNLAEMEGTLVFLMGLSNISEITDRLMEAGKPADTPAAVISNGTMVNQKAIRGTLKDIAGKAANEEMPSPAVIVIGETASYEYLYSPTQNSSQKNIKGNRVGITATDAMWRKLKKGFQDSRMKPVSLCNMKVTPTMEMKSLESELLHLKDYNWILFTSQNGVKLFFEKMAEKEIDVRNLGQVSFAALGSGTATMLMKYGIRADFIPSKYQVAVMAKELAEIISPGQKVLVPRALNGSRELNRIFDENHIYYKDIPMYDVTGHLTGNIRYLDELDYLVFVSASGVSAFFQGLREEKRQLPDGIKLVCIGNITRERLLQEYGDAHIVAAVNDTAGLIAAIKNNQRLSEIGN